MQTQGILDVPEERVAAIEPSGFSEEPRCCRGEALLTSKDLDAEMGKWREWDSTQGPAG